MKVLKIVNFLMIGALIFLSLPSLGHAKSKESILEKKQKEEAAEEELPAALDFDRRKASNMRIELSPYGGDYFGDKLNHTFIVGGNLQVNITERLGIAADFGYSHVSVDRTSLLGLSFTDKNEYLMDGAFVVTMPAVFASKTKAVECDLFSSLGGGILRINGSNRIGGFIGGGMKIRPNIKWLAIRVEIRNYFTSINNPSGSDFEDDMTIRVGPTFLLPPEL